MMKVNSNDWWEEYFKEKIWEINHGYEQSRFFMKILLENLSPELKREVLDNQYSICDVGCAEGDGTNILKEEFVNNHIWGIDFSSTAIHQANNKYPQINFEVNKIDEISNRWDVITCSNVLEHFKEPQIIIDKLLTMNNHYLIIMVPFKEETLEPSHFYRFGDQDFLSFPKGYEIIEKKMIDTSKMNPTYWNGKQLLVVIKNLLPEQIMIENKQGMMFNRQMWDKVNEEYDISISEEEKSLVSEILEIMSSMGIKKGSKIMELGCGNGHLSVCLAEEGYDVTLLDFSSVALDKAKKTFERYNLTGTFIEDDILELSDTSTEYDLIWNSGVMEHFDDINLKTVFLSVKKILGLNNSKFLFLVPNPKSISYLLMRYNLYSQQKWEYGFEYLRTNYLEIAETAGLSGKILGYVSGSISKKHFESTFLHDPNRNMYSHMMDNKLLPDNEKYLIAYAVSNVKENSKAYIQERNEGELLFKQSDIQLEKYFQVNAELFGKNKENQIIKEKIDKLDYEVNLLREELEQKNSILQENAKEINQLEKKLRIKEDELEIIEGNLKNKEKKLNILEKEYKDREEKLECLDKKYKKLNEANIILTDDLNKKNNMILLIKNKCLVMSNSRLFKFVHFIFRSKYQGFNCDKNERKLYRKWLFSKIFSKAGDVDRRYNPVYHILNLMDYSTEVKFQEDIPKKNMEKQKKKEIIGNLRKEISGKRVIIFPYTIDYHMPLFQRPQQLVKAYSKKDNMLAIYLTINAQYDHVKYADKIQKNLWLVEKSFFEKHIDLLEYAKEKILSISLTTNKHYIELIKPHKLIYEYIDELEIFYGYGPEMERDHQILIKQADVTVCTATKLYEQVKDKATNPIISTNAGDYEFFKETKQYNINPLIVEKIQDYDCVLGYYGSLAEWVDYQIIKDVAIKNKNWLWLLVGVDYDGSLEKSGILNLKNVLYIPPQPYEMLPTFLKAFTIATIPFKINEITLSTSPVKLFEYMSGGKPILASKLPECLKYRSVFTYEDSDDFIRKAEEILALSSDNIYWECIKNDALNNTWEAKVDEILLSLNEISIDILSKTNEL